MSMHIDIVKREKIEPQERQQMYSVFSRYYENVDADRFNADLETKDWVIHLRNSDQAIVGFSTLQLCQHQSSSEAVLILYSGDTIVDRANRTNGDLAGAFGHLLMRSLEENDNIPIYWLLTSKGVRTYRFLPVFFKTFFPAYNVSIPPDIKHLIDTIATDKFGINYTSRTQIVSYRKQRDWLCASEHDPMLMKRSNPHISFFLKENPGYSDGDELVCLTEVSRSNLNAKAWRVIDHTEVNWRE